jgi:MurE/MurF fusion protein
MTETGSEMSNSLHSGAGDNWACTAPGTAVSSSGSVTLESLTGELGFSVLSGNPATCSINQISNDSRKVCSHSLFVALAGSAINGHDFVDQAVKAGCSALLVEAGQLDLSLYSSRSELCILESSDTRKAYGLLAEALFSYPAHCMTLLGVTGTNGKTTVSYLLEDVLRDSGRRVGVLGTINYRYYDLQGELQQVPAPFTTPEPMLLQQSLREMADNGVDTVIMEVSSHGLEQNRIGTLLFDVAAFTNLSRDHLDYHGDMDDYFLAKSQLFTKHLRKSAKAVISFAGEDLKWSDKLRTICLDGGKKVLSCGKSDSTDIYPVTVTGNVKQTEISLQTSEGTCKIISPLVGDFNVANILTAFGMAMALGIPIDSISVSLSSASGAPGRMQRIAANSKEQSFRPTVFVDYAHTPDALEQVLKTLKALPHTNLYCIFGCGGDRDSGKRQLMGEVAGNYCDVAILTDDNPRSEDSGAILSAIIEGISNTTLLQKDHTWLSEKGTGEKGFVVIADRHRAIVDGVAAAGNNDIVLIAGKGHENYQISPKGRRFFDDSLEAAEALSSWTIESLVNATKGSLVGESSNGKLNSIKIDSRKIKKGDIFVAIVGERFDAHAYLEQVVEAGAGCLVVDRMVDSSFTVPVILVNDTEQALGDLASYRRTCMKEISTPLIAAITGSSGKTTAKEMCAAIFMEQWPDQPDVPEKRLLKTEGNFNNLIGLPLSLLPVSPKHRAVILEMGMNCPGEIKRLTEIAAPDIACILNVHGAHLLGLGSIEGVANAKEELFQNCGGDTLLVINSDDSRVSNFSQKYTQDKVFFGLTKDSSNSLDIYASDMKKGHMEDLFFILHVADQQAPVHLQVPGLHNILNGLAAAAISHAAGVDITLIARGLSSFVPTDRRMEVVSGPGGSRIINDTYNANPESMKAGLTTLGELGTGQRLAVLGDMLELGEESEKLHREVGAHAAASGIDSLAVIGDFSSFTATGAIENGMDENEVHIFSGQDECRRWLTEVLTGKNVERRSYVLVKGSRGMHLDQLVEQLTGT